jgi:hypothetical protein
LPNFSNPEARADITFFPCFAPLKECHNKCTI